LSRKIAVIGTGYVGLVAAVGLADFGNHLIGVDIDSKKVEALNNCIPTIYEPGIREYLDRNIKSGRLTFSTDIDGAIRDSEVIFIAVGTPPGHDGSADLSQLDAAIESIAANLDDYKVIVTKSTVPVGTNRWIKEEIEKRMKRRMENGHPEMTGGAAGEDFDVVSNPEFLREGKALQDFFHPDRIVIGCESGRAKEILMDVYRALNLIQVPIVWCNLETAELVKYASNAFLATKITFMNQMANLAEAVGGDIHMIAKAMGMDGRISAKFLHPGPGYGGSCFPKDTRAIAATGAAHGVDMSLIEEVIRSNEKQKLRMVSKLKRLTGAAGEGTLRGMTIAVLGLAFKAETDDTRESPSIVIVRKLLEEGAKIRAHDPKAVDNFRALFDDLYDPGTMPGEIEYFEDEFDAVKDAAALVICTDWNEYRNLDLERVGENMAGRIILDTRNVLDSHRAKEEGFIYEGVGRSVR